MCRPVSENIGRRSLRSAVRRDLVVPVTRTARYPRSFAVAGPGGPSKTLYILASLRDQWSHTDSNSFLPPT